MDCLMEVQLSRKNALLCLKTQVDFATCNTILSDWNFTGTKLQTVIEKAKLQRQSTQSNLAQWIKDKFHYIIKKGFKITYSGLESLLFVTLAYLDLSLDSVLLLSIFIALGSTISDYTLFSSQVVYLQCASIIFPALATATTIAFRWPHVVIGSDDWIMCSRPDIVFDRKKLVVLRIVIIGFSPMVPALVIMSNLRANHKREQLKDKLQDGDTMSQTSAIEESESITQFINECRLALLTFKRNELNLELVPQLSIHITMVLLTLTLYPVESGLQSLFKDTNADASLSWKNQLYDIFGGPLVFLAISVIWSFKTCILTAIKIKNETKNILPLFPKCVLGLRYLIIFINRIGSIVTYYAPYIGLIMLMNHYHAELIPLDAETWSSFNNTFYEYWNPITNEVESRNISELFRSNYTDTANPQPPSITLYTLTDLRTAYGLFWAIYLFYAILIFLVKLLFNEDFKKASKWEKLQHIIETLNNPEAFGDWDTDHELDLDAHLQKWWNILLEMWIMGFLQLLTNFCLLIPFFVTANNIKARHELLEGAIGTFQEEDNAYSMVTTLSWILPTTVILSAMLDALLVWIYMKLAHPWKDILFGQEEEEKRKKKYYKSQTSIRKHIPDDFM